jgi:hypothetical protein
MGRGNDQAFTGGGEAIVPLTTFSCPADPTNNNRL